MSMHVPALHAPPIPADAEPDAAAEAVERRRDFIETSTTVFVVVMAVTLISALNVALQLD
jgi:hypothetical protein